MEELDKHIAAIETKIKEEPFNEEFQITRQTLYKLKAIGNIMEEKVVVDHGAILPEIFAEAQKKRDLAKPKSIISESKEEKVVVDTKEKKNFSKPKSIISESKETLE